MTVDPRGAATCEYFECVREAEAYADAMALRGFDAVVIEFFDEQAVAEVPLYVAEGRSVDGGGQAGVREPRRTPPYSSPGAISLDLP